MGLREEAIRLLRTRWRDRADLLAEELYLILSQAADPTTGPITVKTGDDNSIKLLIPDFALDPLGGFNLPDLDLPSFDLNPFDVTFEDTPLPDPITEPGRPGNGVSRRRRKRRMTEHIRTALPGQVVSGSGSSYTVDLYPNGSTATFDDGTPAKVTVEDVRQLQIATGETIPAGTWVCPVFRHTTLRITLTEIVERGATGGERIVARNTDIEVVDRVHEMQVPVWLSP